MDSSARCGREGTEAEGDSCALRPLGLYGWCFLHLSAGSVRHPPPCHGESAGKFPGRGVGSGSPRGRAAPTRPPAPGRSLSPRCRAGSLEHRPTDPGAAPRPAWERAAAGLAPRPQSGLWSSAIPGGGRDGGREEGGSASPPSPPGQGGGADTGDGLRPRLGDGETKCQGRSALMERSLPPFPALRGGSWSGACARRGCREGAAFQAAALGTHVGLGVRGWK